MKPTTRDWVFAYIFSLMLAGLAAFILGLCLKPPPPRVAPETVWHISIDGGAR